MQRNSTPRVCLNALAAAGLLCGAVSAGQPTEQLVLLFNEARVKRDVIIRAQDQAAWIFRNAGIDLRWLDCTAAPETSSCFRRFNERPLMIKVAASAGPFPNRKSLGYAAVDNGGGYFAVAYLDRIERLVKRTDFPSGSGGILGLVIAHEIGHLLLSQVGHTSRGIMTAHWGDRQMRQAVNGELLFTRDEAAKMCREVRQRDRRNVTGSDR